MTRRRSHTSGRKAVASAEALTTLSIASTNHRCRRNRGDKNDTEIAEAVEDMANRRYRQGEAIIGERVVQAREAMPPRFKPIDSNPGDHGADCDRDQAGRDTAVTDAAEPTSQDDAKQVMPMSGVMNMSSAGRIEMKVMETPARVPRRAAARSNAANQWSDEAPDHQNEALDEDPSKAGFPSLNWVTVLDLIGT